MATSRLWTTLLTAVRQPDEHRLGLWAWLREKLDVAQYRPEAAVGIVASSLTGREGQYYIIKNPETKAYHRLSERDHFLWELMDGSRTVKELVVAYFLEYGSFAFARVATLVSRLRDKGFLVDTPTYVYGQVRSQLLRRSPSYRLNRIWAGFMQTQFALKGLDPFLDKVYRWGGRLFFTRPAVVLYVIISLVGIVLFGRVFSSGDYSLVATAGGSVALGLVTLVAAQFVSIMLHELAHALTVKHYGREVRSAGVMIYMGLPGFFVDTTDIWMERKRARLAVSWAGPFSGLVLAGLASAVITLWPDFALNSVLLRFGFLTYLLVFLNLNPLLQLDGYYLLMDWLEIPMLRNKSLAFIRHGLPAKFKGAQQPAEEGSSKPNWRDQLRSFSREERIFTVFGILSAIWTAFAAYYGLRFWQTRLAGTVGGLLETGGDSAGLPLAILAVAVSAIFVIILAIYPLQLLRNALSQAAQRGVFANTWLMAAILLTAALALILVPGLTGYAHLLPYIALVGLAAATYFAWRNALDYAGSRLAPAFWLMGAFSLALLLREATALGLDSGLLPSGFFEPLAIALGTVAFVSLFLAGLTLFADTNLKELRAVEKALLALGLLATFGSLLWLGTGGFDVRGLLAIAGGVVPLLVLILMLPTLFSFWRTRFGPAWIMLALSLAGLAVMPFVAGRLKLPLRAFSYLLLAGGFALHRLAYQTMTLLRDQPEPAVDLSDRRRLQRAFGWTATAVLAQFGQCAGERAGSDVVDRFNTYALAAGWRVHAARGEIEDSVPGNLGLIEQGQVYSFALNLLLDLVSQEMGRNLTVRALQRAYDGLPWEERELGNRYLFRDVDLAEALSREFQTTQQDYLSLLRRMPLFATMDEVEIELICSRLRLGQVAARQAIIRQGDRGDRFYIVRRGHVEVTQRDDRGVTEVVNQLDRGDCFGEVALLRDAPRNATCRATVPTEVLSLSRQDFDRLVKARFALREKVDRSIARADLLRRMPLFSEMDAQQVRLVAAQLLEEVYQPGAVIIRQGDIGETFYVIESGRVRVSVYRGANAEGRQVLQEKVVAERGPGEYVGEIALLLSVPRTAAVRALTETKMLVLHKDDFDRLVTKYLYVSRELEQETSRRMIDLRRAA